VTFSTSRLAVGFSKSYIPNPVQTNYNSIQMDFGNVLELVLCNIVVGIDKTLFAKASCTCKSVCGLVSDIQKDVVTNMSELNKTLVTTGVSASPADIWKALSSQRFKFPISKMQLAFRVASMDRDFLTFDGRSARLDELYAIGISDAKVAMMPAFEKSLVAKYTDGLVPSMSIEDLLLGMALEFVPNRTMVNL